MDLGGQQAARSTQARPRLRSLNPMDPTLEAPPSVLFDLKKN